MAGRLAKRSSSLRRGLESDFLNAGSLFMNRSIYTVAKFVQCQNVTLVALFSRGEE